MPWFCDKTKQIQCWAPWCTEYAVILWQDQNHAWPLDTMNVSCCFGGASQNGRTCAVMGENRCCAVATGQALFRHFCCLDMLIANVFVWNDPSVIKTCQPPSILKKTKPNSKGDKTLQNSNSAWGEVCIDSKEDEVLKETRFRKTSRACPKHKRLRTAPSEKACP